MILIIQNGYCDTHISKYLNEEIEVVCSFKVNNLDTYIEKINMYSTVIILGGHQSTKKLDKNLLSVIQLIRSCVDNRVPLLGICLGCQLIAYVFGCEIKSLEKMNYGYDTSVLKYTNIFRCHNDYIVPNNMIEIIDIYDSMPYIFKIKSQNIYGVQCHPDIPPEFVSEFYNNKEIKEFGIKNQSVIDENNKKFMAHILDLLTN